MSTRKRKFEKTACALTLTTVTIVFICVLSGKTMDTHAGGSVQDESLAATTPFDGSDSAMTTSKSQQSAGSLRKDAHRTSEILVLSIIAMVSAVIGAVVALNFIQTTSSWLKPLRFHILRDTCAMAARPMRTVVLTYGVSLAAQLILGALVHVIESDSWAEQEQGAGFDRSLMLVLTTFVGGSYGDAYPVSTAGRVVIAMVSTLGYVLQLFHIVLVVQTTLNLAAQGDVGNRPSAFTKFKMLMPIYLMAACVALMLGILTHAVDGIEPICVGAKHDCDANILDGVYLLWMTVHGTTFGEVTPDNDGARLITWLAMMINYFLTISFAALTAIPNNQNYNFINIPLLRAGPTANLATGS